MKLYRATYSFTSYEGKTEVDEQWVFFEAENHSVALEKITVLLTEMWECIESRVDVWNVYDESDLIMLSLDMGVDSPDDWRFFEVGYGPEGCTRLNPSRDGWPLFLVSPARLARLNNALVACQQAGGQHD